MTTLWGKRLSDDQMYEFYFTNNLFKIEGIRNPTEEEVLGIFTVLQGQGNVPRPAAARALFNNCANPEDEQTKELHAGVQPILKELNNKVNDAFGKLIRQDADALYRSIALQGIPQRLELPKLSRMGTEWSHGNPVKPYQLIPLSNIATNCENEDGTPITAEERYKVVKICLFANAEGTEKFVTRFATPGQQITQEMETWMAEHNRYRDQFLDNTQFFLNIYKQQLEAASLKVRIRRLPRRNPVPTGTTVATATTAIEALTLGATANPDQYQDFGQHSGSDEDWAEREKETTAGGLPPPPPPRPNTDNPYGGRPPSSFHGNQPTGSRQESQAARKQGERPKGGQETGKRKEPSQSSYRAEPSKRRETDRPEPEIERDPSGKFRVDSMKSPPPPPKVHGSGRISYPTDRPEHSRRRPRERRDPTPPPAPGSHRDSRSDRGDEDKRREPK